MNRANDCTTVLPGKISKDFHDVRGCERVKTGRWLIKEDQTRVCDQLDTDGCSFTLTAGDTLDKRTADSGIGALGQLQVVDELVDACYFHWQSAWKFEFGSELETLSYRHRLEQDIVLLHVG